MDKKAELSYLIKLLLWIMFILVGCFAIYQVIKFIGM